MKAKAKVDEARSRKKTTMRERDISSTRKQASSPETCISILEPEFSTGIKEPDKKVGTRQETPVTHYTSCTMVCTCLDLSPS